MITGLLIAVGVLLLALGFVSGLYCERFIQEKKNSKKSKSFTLLD